MWLDFPAIIPQVYKECFEIVLHISLSQPEHTACGSELDPGDGLMNTKGTGKNSIPGVLQWGKEEVKVLSTS